MISFSNSIVKRQVGVACITGSLSKKPGTCCPRSVLYCTTCTGGSNTRRHAHVHERSYTSCDPILPGLTCWRSAFNCGDRPFLDEWHCDILAIQKCDISVTEMLDYKNYCRSFHVNLFNCLFAFGIGFRLSCLRGFIAWSNKFNCQLSATCSNFLVRVCVCACIYVYFCTGRGADVWWQVVTVNVGERGGEWGKQVGSMDEES